VRTIDHNNDGPIVWLVLFLSILAVIIGPAFLFWAYFTGWVR
jgi:hypothetical protein